MRIGIDARMYGPRFTGIGVYTERLISYLSEHDHENEYVLFLRKEGMIECTVEAPNFKKVLADINHYSFAEQTLFPWILSKEKLDLMHFTHFNAPIFYRGKSVATIHDLTLSFYPGRKMTSALHRKAYSMTLASTTRKAERIIAISEYTKKDLVQILDIPENKIAVVYNGIDVEKFQHPSNGQEISVTKDHLGIKSSKYLLYVGVFREHKNLVRLVEAFARIEKQFPDIELVLAGKEDPTYHDVRDAIVRLNLSGRVRLPGYVQNEDLVPLYRGATAYVFPSLYEGFGLPVLEAMAAGIPVVSSRNSSLPEVAGEDNALFFDPLSLDSITQALQTILSNEKLRNTLVAKGKKRVKDFSWERMGREILETYREVLKTIK